MVDSIKSSAGSQGVGKCNGCQKTVLLGELFRCTTCMENSASAAGAEIRVCCMCVVTSHRGHNYMAWLDVPSKADVDDAREKLDGYDGANAVDEAELQENKCNILTAIKQLEKMIAMRTVSLATLKDDVDGSNTFTKAQLAEKVQQAEQMMENVGFKRGQKFN
ncbi:hypothetical protein AAVH_30630 [Aphelenchoides avenae]|nr:hypothetical protein AAVH_30630 [Aphelenchus avenae]